MNEEIFKKMMELYADPDYQKGFTDFFIKMQQEGIEAARKYWMQSAARGEMNPQASDIFEQMISFYSGLGFVPKQKHDEIVEENRRLKEENESLRRTISELNVKVFTEGGERVQKAWSEVVEKQVEIGGQVAQSIIDLLKPPGKKP